jgi:nucleoside-diphosphate-sugar epimerase
VILVTGAGGYLGRFVMERLRTQGVDAVANTDDLTKPVVPRPGVTRVLHLAAKTPKAPNDYQDEERGRETVEMLLHVREAYACPIVLASSHVASEVGSAYARAKWTSEYALKNSGRSHCIVRLPGLFGLPRRGGTIYEAALRHDVRESYGPYPAMHVIDAAELFVRIALAFDADGDAEIHTIIYERPWMLKARVQQFATELACVH